MRRWGNLDRKNIVYVLDNGISFLKDELKDQDRSGSTNIEEFYSLESLLYGEGERLLSMTNKVRFESRLNTIRKKMHIWEKQS